MISTPGRTEEIPRNELLELIREHPAETLGMILQDLHWLLGYARGQREAVEILKEQGDG